MIGLAATDAEIEACYAVMRELRPHLSAADFLAQVKRQMGAYGFRLVYCEHESEIVAVGGIRLAEWLAGGRYLEIEDLVAKDGARSRGHGGALFDWCVEHARANGCRQLRLVSHVVRFGAHRFYLRRGMNIEAHYFSMSLEGGLTGAFIQKIA